MIKVCVDGTGLPPSIKCGANKLHLNVCGSKGAACLYLWESQTVPGPGIQTARRVKLPKLT